MKIAFITFSCAWNYGAVLQTYATYKYLKDQGHQVELIDYVSLPYQIDRKDFVYLSTTRWSKNFVTRLIWKYTRHQNEIRCRDRFRGFIDQYVPHTETCYSNEYLKEHLPKADLFLTGSDQIWNTDYSWTGTPDVAYFLDFVPDDVPKMAYSSSFGKTELKAEETPLLKKLLSRFVCIGVREKTGQDILSGLGIDAAVVADPTLLCRPEDWDALASPRLIAEDYILLFQIVPSAELIGKARALAAKTGKKLVILAPKLTDRKVVGSDGVLMPPVEDWLSYFKHASFIITDSFHGTIFAMNNRVNFITSIQAKYSSRITNMLDRLGLSDRYAAEITAERLDQAMAHAISYDEVGQSMDALTCESKAWLEQAIARCGTWRQAGK